MTKVTSGDLMLATLAAVSQPIRGEQQPLLDTFGLVVAVSAIILWIVAANYRTRRSG